MRILLVNNASGVHEYMRRGLLELGHEVVLAVQGVDGGQGRPTDVVFGNPGSTLGDRLRRIVEPYRKLRALGRFDVASYQLGLTLFGSPLTRYEDLHLIKRQGTLLSYYGLGCDEPSLLRIRPDVDVMPCKTCMQYDPHGARCAKERLARRPRASRHTHLFDFTVTSAYIYDQCLDFFPKAQKAAIQFPIDARSLAFNPARNKAKPLIIHSPTKIGFKGTHNILEAMRLLGERRDDFEFRVVKGLSHDEYLRTMQDCDVYLDQIFSADSFGIAALENMAIGKVVISGNGPLGWVNFPFMSEAPVVRAAIEPARLADIVSGVLDRKADFERLGEQGRAYVLRHHDHADIAARFVSLWTGGGTANAQSGEAAQPTGAPA